MKIPNPYLFLGGFGEIFDQGRLEDFIIEQATVNNYGWNKSILKDVGFNELHYILFYMSFKLFFILV